MVSRNTHNWKFNLSGCLFLISLLQRLAFLFLLLALQVHADTLLGKVINVADGDTITVLDDTNTQQKIRLTGIDAPEKRQAFGNVSKQNLADMVAGQSVAVEWVNSNST